MESGGEGSGRHCSLSAPPPHTASQRSEQRYPTLGTPKALPLKVTEAPRQKKKKMAQITEHFKAPEKIQLSEEEIANLLDAQFQTLVIKMLTDLVESI